MKFGTKKSDVVITDGGDYLRTFRKGETRVRFLDDPADWIEYREHFTLEGRMFPCSRKTLGHCPGCESDNERVSRSSRKYATNIYLVDIKRVLPFKIPVGLANSLERRQERSEDKTITDRDFIVVRSGDGLDTSYDADPDDRYTMDLKALDGERADIESIFASKFTECWPDISLGNADKVEEVQEDFPTKASSDDIELDEATVRRMTLPELTELAGKAGVDISSAENKSGVVQILINKLSA